MLALEQIHFLLWMKAQETPVSQVQMEESKATYYTFQRIENLYKDGYLIRGIGVGADGEYYGVYSISDKGRAALLEYEQLCQQRAEKEEQQRQKERREAIRLQERLEDQANEDRRSKNQNKTALLAALISGTSGLLLGILIEHFVRVVDIVLSLCQ